MSLVDRTSSEFKDYLELYEQASLLELGQLADAERWRQHPENVVTYMTGTSTTPTSASPIANSARSTAAPSISKATYSASSRSGPRSTSARPSAEFRFCSR